MPEANQVQSTHDNSTDSSLAAEVYYDSSDADQFYTALWGGEDIHVGLYADEKTDVRTASQQTVELLSGKLEHLPAASELIDLGAGYGGAARHLARHYGHRVTCLNISSTQNANNARFNQQQNLQDRVLVEHGSFENIPAEAASFDAAWSQDSFLHSGNRRGVLEEILRVLKPGGELIFTDPMQADDCPAGVLEPVLERIHLESLGSFQFYQDCATELGFETVECIDLSKHLGRHYARIRAELNSRYDEMIQKSSQDYVDTMLTGLQHWVDAAKNGYLAWGIMHFRKP